MNLLLVLCTGLGSEGFHSSDREEVRAGEQPGLSHLICHEERWTSPHSAVRNQERAER